MLILTRKYDESIIIGDNIRMVVLGIDIYKKSVKIGIEAPKDIPVNREEIYIKLKEQGLSFKTPNIRNEEYE